VGKAAVTTLSLSLFLNQAHARSYSLSIDLSSNEDGRPRKCLFLLCGGPGESGGQPFGFRLACLGLGLLAVAFDFSLFTASNRSTAARPR
jgi:hypothetical protein